MSEIKSHRDLRVWKNAMDLAQTIYELAKTFPPREEYRLTSQMIRAAISIPANITEGHMRGTRKDYANFISIAPGVDRRIGDASPSSGPGKPRTHWSDHSSIGND